MTELEKKAEAYVSEKADKGNFDVEKFGKAYFSESSMIQALVKFAEPREKRIAELESNFRICEKNADTYYDQLTKAKELLKRCYENYIYLEPLRSEIKQFLNGDGCPDVLCEDCTKEDCTVKKKLGLVSTKEIKEND